MARLRRESDRDQSEHDGGDHVQGDRCAAVVLCEQRGGDQRGRRTGSHGRELRADRGTRVPHPRREHLREEGRLGRVHPTVKHQPDRHGSHEPAETPGVHECEERKRPEPYAGGSHQIDGPPPDPVREGTPGRDGREVHGGADEHGVEGGLLGQLGVLGGVDEDEGGDDVVADVLRHTGTHGDQDVAPVVPQHRDEGRLLRLTGGGPCEGGFEDRRLVHGQPDPEPHDHEQPRQQKRHPPAPRQEGRIGQQRRQRGQHPGGEQLPGRSPGLRPSSPEPPPLGITVLGHQQHGPAPLPTQRKPLHEPEQSQQHGRQRPDGGMGRQHPNGARSTPHHHQTHHKQPLPPQPVPEMPEHQRPDGPRNEAHGVGEEGKQRPDDRIGPGKEELVKDERGGGSVEEEVVPLDSGPDEARDDDFGE